MKERLEFGKGKLHVESAPGKGATILRSWRWNTIGANPLQPGALSMPTMAVNIITEPFGYLIFDQRLVMRRPGQKYN